VFNPNATTTDARVRDVIAAALASELTLDVHPTKQRGHATHLVAGAVHEGYDVVFVLGGDGTVNEAVQALAGTHVQLGVIPGGSTNVLARTIGLPNDAVTATAVLLERLRAGASRRIGLGRANGRYFTFIAGFGYDAAVVQLVERRARLKRAIRQASFVWCALQVFFASYRKRTPVRVELPDRPPQSGFGVTIVSNSTPFTFLGPRPLKVAPDARFETGLDLVGVRTMTATSLLSIVGQVLTTARHIDRRGVEYWHDLPAFALASDEPLPWQVDGDYAGTTTRLELVAVPDALTVVA